MKMAIETFTMVTIITLGCILFASIISSNEQNAVARDFYNVVVNRIEDSNGNAAVVSDCIKEAEEIGYSLEVKDITDYARYSNKFVVLSYKIKMPIFETFGSTYEKQAVIEGYAR